MVRSFLILVLVLSACSSGTGDTAVPPTPLTTASGFAGRIGYLDGAGNVAVMLPDGSQKTTLANSSPTTTFVQPTWDPRGDRLAWTAIEGSPAGAVTSVRIAGTVGHEPIDVPLATAPFYFYWSPDGEKLAALGSGAEGLDLWIISGGRAQTAASGQPFYFAWAPDSALLASHVGNRTLSFVSPAGEQTIIDDRSEGYQAPAWSVQDDLAYVSGQSSTLAGPAVAQEPGLSRLVVGRADGGPQRVVQTFSGFASFSFSPQGTDLAYSVSGLDARLRANVNFGPLVVHRLGEGTSTEVEPDPVVLYQWSPDGTRLLYATPIQAAAALLWRVWGPEGSTDYGTFTPTQVFLQAYLPFWDQYALSSNLWSPDGRAFVYTARQAGRDTVFVQPLDASAPVGIEAGSVAFWSP